MASLPLKLFLLPLPICPIIEVSFAERTQEMGCVCRLAALIDERNLKLSEAGTPAKRLTQRLLAQETKLAGTTLSRLYNNDFDRVDKKTIETLCNYFNCEVGDLFVMRDR